MSATLKFITKYAVIGLACAFLYVLISGKINPQDKTIQQPQLLFSYAPAINQITTSVVSIHIQSNQRRPINAPGISPRTPYQTKNYLGSGVIVSTNGHIVTNKHVIDGATRVVVYLWDNRAFEASFVGADPLSDLAVIKINAADLNPAEFADSDLINTGDVVLAVGNPYGLNQSASLGIVSATGRQGLVESQAVQLENYIQTDAAINQGNSGGPLINPLGQVVGLSAASYGQFGAEGINFAIPSNTTVRIVNELIEHGKVLRGWVGLGFLMDAGYAMYGIPKPAKGIMVHKVHPDSAADLAGIKAMDVITHINDQTVNSFEQYRKILYENSIGDAVTLTGYNQDGDFSHNLTIEPPLSTG
ncbi:trypsin-like peptidase domain-containing protein [Marinicella sp. S1101]|uniref:S1C family serine protease n=1 Tax=Marinicella marina TaxID=2996016 RepID=UPI002260DF2D|nr:trypsin-like peptidase domain-containing protein [Marinicella marina]MCX7552710.1 trypsin-like peptidase domain-containing protein [Marinicella marina]MDJ1139981.1 trypsin-like peptidase domain-containing protein [Marinicella marina]